MYSHPAIAAELARQRQESLLAEADRLRAVRRSRERQLFVRKPRRGFLRLALLRSRAA